MANEMMAGSEKAIVPSRDIKPGMDVLDEIAAAVGDDSAEVEETEMAETEMPAETDADAPAAAAAPSEDAEVIATALGIDAMQAQMLFDAAQMMEITRGKSGKDLAAMLEKDFSLRMELEKLAGGVADQMQMGLMEGAGAEMPPEPPPEMPAA